MALAASGFEPTGELARGRGGFLRNSKDTPYVTDPAGGIVKSGPRKGLPKRAPYGSPSGFGKLIENTFNLQKWGERRVVLGIGTDLALIAACHALTLLDVDSDKYKEQADKIVVAAKEAAQTSLAAERGTHAHALAEDDDEGRDWIERAEAGELLGIPVDAQRALVAAWREMLVRDGLEVLTTEASCIDDTWRLAGTLDNHARCTRELRFRLATGEIRTIPAGTVVVLDKKTGQLRRDRNGVPMYWHGYVVQVASYAQSVPYDTETEQRCEWPYEVDQEHALIAHLDVLGAIEGNPSCTLVYVDLVAGREQGGATVVAAKAWGARTDLLSVGQLDDENTIADPAGCTVVEQPAEGSGTGNPAPLGEIDSAASLAESAPAPDVDLPSTTASVDLPSATPAQVTPSRIVDEYLAAVAAEPKPLPTTPDEGADLSDPSWFPTWNALQTQFEALTGEAQLWTSSIIKQARTAGVGFQKGGGQTSRRFELYRGLIPLAAAQPNDEALRALVALAMDSDAPLFPSVTPGHALGALDADEAKRFALLVDAFIAGQFVGVIDETSQAFRLAPHPQHDLAATTAA